MSYSPNSFNRAAGIPTEPIPVASYARISADKKKNAAVGGLKGVTNQHRENGETAARFGCVVVCEITDNDKSVSKGTVYREEFEALIWALAHDGRCRLPGHSHVIQGVVVVEQSRLARTFGEWERFTDTLIASPDRIYIQAGAWKDPYGEAFDFEGVIEMVGNKREPKKISVRVTRDHMSRAIAGDPVPGRRLFGYAKDGKHKRAAEAPYAEEMIGRALAGDSISSITRWIQAQDVTTSVGGKWKLPAVRTWLRNPKMAGWRRMNRTGLIILDPETHEPKVGSWETYCTPEQWQQIDTRFQASKGRKWDFTTGTPGDLIVADPAPKLGRGRKYLLSGFARCGKCSSMLTTGPHPTQAGHWTYRCPTRAQGGCAGVARDMKRLDTYITECLLIQAAQEAANARPADAADEWPDATELADALESRAALLAAYDNGRGTVTAETFYAVLLPGAEERIRAAQLGRDRWTLQRQRQQALPQDPWTEWDQHAADLRWRQDLVGDHIVSVIVKPSSRGNRFCVDDYEIIWRG